MNRRTFLKSVAMAGVVGALAGAGTLAGILDAPVKASAAGTEPSRILIVYFSHTNNTRTVAEQIQILTGGRLLELKTTRQYPGNHKETVAIAVQENKSSARPELTTVFPTNMDDYDTIFVGYPVWEYTMPMALFTFFDQYKFPGKTIIPFSTHQGSGLGGGPRDIARLCPEATILDGLAIRGSNADKSQNDVERWLKKLSFPL